MSGLTAQFCKCNNCEEVYYDTNPSDQPFFEVPEGKTFRSLITFDFPTGMFEGCPTCEDDGCLIDVVDEQLL
jgi:hypothetical protein